MSGASPASQFQRKRSVPEIKAFKGWRYKRDAVGNFASVLAPPYDVISPKQRDELYKKNPFNVVRLILGKTKKGDTARHNQYTRARQFLNQWISKSVLTRDHEPAIYVYAQDYKETGKVRTRLGFLAAMRINEKAVLKHENTLAKPKKDRTALLKEVRTNLSPIFGLFEDKKGSVQEILKESLKSRPVIDVSIEGVRHRLYVENRRGPVSRLSGLLAFRPMFIADGHHRFEVACQFRNWMNSRQRDKDAPWNYVMTYFSDCLHNPFRIFPTHRLISIPGSVKNPLELLKKRGHLTRAKGLPAILSVLSKTREESGQKGYSFGVYKKGEGFFIFNLSPRLNCPPGILTLAARIAFCTSRGLRLCACS